MTLSTIIIDDEFLARERLKKMLRSFNTVQVLGECKNADDALVLIPLKQPDFIFLDIEMPGMSGMDLVLELQKNMSAIPHVIFTTAYNNYAVKAFDNDAIDYLLKPFEMERLEKALLKITTQIELKQSKAIHEQVKSILKSHESTGSPFREFFEIKSNGLLHNIYTSDIHFIQSDGNYVKICTAEKEWLYRDVLQKIATELNPISFLRIHRSIIINVNFVSTYRYLGNNEFSFSMLNGKKFISSRSFKESISTYYSSH